MARNALMIRDTMLIACLVGFVALIGLAGSTMGVTGQLAGHQDGPIPLEVKSVAGVAGEGFLYGSRDNRQSLVVYDNHGEISLEITLYGPPERDTDPYGPQVARAVTTLPRAVQDWLRWKLAGEP